MMNDLILEQIDDAPYFPSVHFIASTGILEISGQSYMEETYKFYEPLINWLKEYLSKRDEKLVFNFKLTYFNTGSSRLILSLLDVLKEFIQKGGEANITWYFDPEDPDMEVEVKDFISETGIDIGMEPFEL